MRWSTLAACHFLAFACLLFHRFIQLTATRYQGIGPALKGAVGQPDPYPGAPAGNAEGQRRNLRAEAPALYVASICDAPEVEPRVACQRQVVPVRRERRPRLIRHWPRLDGFAHAIAQCDDVHALAALADRRHREVPPHGDRKLQLLRWGADTGDTARLRRAEQRAVIQLPHRERSRVREPAGGARREGEEQATSG